MDNDNKVIIDQALGDGAKILSGLRNNIATLEKDKRLTCVERRYLVIEQLADIIGEKENDRLSLDLSSVKKENALIRDSILETSKKGEITDSEISALENRCTRLEQKLGINSSSNISQNRNSFKDRTSAIIKMCGVHNVGISLQVHQELGDIFEAEQKELSSIDAKIAEANNYIELLKCMPNLGNKPNAFGKELIINQDFWSNRIEHKGTQQEPLESTNPGLAHKESERKL